jgi:hypothetical protein
MKRTLACVIVLAAAGCGYTPPGGNPPNCNPGYTDCNDGSNDMCVDTTSDSSNCGSCGNACKAQWFCYSGSCIPKCPVGLDQCNGRCADVSIDPDNCGSCGAACENGQTCSAGKCSTPCPVGYSLCSPAEAGPYCADERMDPENCGGCDDACLAPASDCCGGSCVDLLTDPANCGDCGRKCSTDGGGSCAAGHCAP